ncbi:MAG: putative metal-binding protein [Candidatus Acidiferrales bacterium]
MPVQYTDPTVSRCKFDRELTEYRALGEEYRRRGWFLVHSEFPKVIVVLSAPKLKPSAVIMGVTFDYTNYDAAPPSVRIVNPFTGEPYKLKELPNPLNRALPAQEISLPGMPAAQKMLVGSLQPYMQAYGQDDIPFLCLAGVREYHEHPAHSGDLWELHRASGAGRLVRLLEIIYRYGVDPITGFGVQLVPQVGFNYGPAPS